CQRRETVIVRIYVVAIHLHAVEVHHIPVVDQVGRDQHVSVGITAAEIEVGAEINGCHAARKGLEQHGVCVRINIGRHCRGGGILVGEDTTALGPQRVVKVH